MARRRYHETASQTAGPYLHIGVAPKVAGIEADRSDLGSSMKNGAPKGHAIRIAGTLFDGLGAPVTDALIELWQADANGLFQCPQETRGSADPGFIGWGRRTTDMQTGAFSFETIKPGRVPGFDKSLQAPHISVWVAARGINIGLHTRIYFDDETEANQQDPVLKRIRPPNRIDTLMARRTADGEYRFDIHLQGPAETVFFDI